MTEPLPQPFIGLRPFRIADSALFYGREAQVVALLRRLEDRHFLAVIGASGSGKSSLIRAGLLPAIDEGFLFDRRDWLTLVIRPGSQPYARLAEAMSGELGSRAGEESTAAALYTAIRRSDRGFLDVCAALVAPERHVLLVVDQFEELFGFRRSNTAKETLVSRDEAAAFTTLLLHSSADAQSRVWVVLAMRSDFSGDCDAFLGLPEAMSAGQFLVPRLDRWQMEEAIKGPSQTRGQRFAPFALEDGLTNRVINDAGDRSDQLPLMQHALMQTWKLATEVCGAAAEDTVLTVEQYELVGGIENALSRHADSAWEMVLTDPLAAVVARRLFLLLSDIAADGQLVRRRATVQELMTCTGAGLPAVAGVLAAFNGDDRNFIDVVPEGPLRPDSVLDVCHEALLRRWNLFAKEWLIQERNDVTELRRLADQADSRSTTGLLPAGILGRVDTWAGRVTRAWAERYVSAETWNAITVLIADSRMAAKDAERETRRQETRLRRWKRVAIALVLVSALVVGWMGFSAVRARNALETALTNSYVRVIGLSDRLSPGEAAALWELAASDRSSPGVRKSVIKRWFASDTDALQSINRYGAGVVAASGLDTDLLNYTAQRAQHLVTDYWGKAGTSAPESDPQGALVMGSIAWILGTLFDQSAIEQTAGELVRALESNSMTPDQRKQLADEFASVVPLVAAADARERLERDGVRVIDKRIRESLQNPIDSLGPFAALGQLAGVAPAVAQASAKAAADRITTGFWYSNSGQYDADAERAAFPKILATMSAGSARDALAARFAAAVHAIGPANQGLAGFFGIQDADVPGDSLVADVVHLMSPAAARAWGKHEFDLRIPEETVSAAPVVKDESSRGGRLRAKPRDLGTVGMGAMDDALAALALAQISDDDVRDLTARAVARFEAAHADVSDGMVATVAKLLPRLDEPRRTRVANLAAARIFAATAAPNPYPAYPLDQPYSLVNESTKVAILQAAGAQIRVRESANRVQQFQQDLNTAREPPSKNATGKNGAGANPRGQGSASTSSKPTSFGLIAPYPLADLGNLAFWMPVLSSTDANGLAVEFAQSVIDSPGNEVPEDRFATAAMPYPVAVAAGMDRANRTRLSDDIMNKLVHDHTLSADQAKTRSGVEVALIGTMAAEDVDRFVQLVAPDVAVAPSSRVVMIAEPLIAGVPRMTPAARNGEPGRALLKAVADLVRRSDNAGAQQSLALGRLAGQLAAAGADPSQLRLAALSLMLMDQAAGGVPINEEMSGLIDSLDRRELITVLKWPVTGYEARQRILAKLASAHSPPLDIFAFAVAARGQDRQWMDARVQRPNLSDALAANLR